jgi:dolichyl-phosphate-mannose-protein mannosyltransferase
MLTRRTVDAKAEKVNYRNPGFLRKFLELQHVMWTTNAGLTDRHAYDSRPQSWPVLRRGIKCVAEVSASRKSYLSRAHSFWVKDHRQIYLIGNPVVWYLSTLSVLAYVGIRALLILR